MDPEKRARSTSMSGTTQQQQQQQQHQHALTSTSTTTTTTSSSRSISIVLVSKMRKPDFSRATRTMLFFAALLNLFPHFFWEPDLVGLQLVLGQHIWFLILADQEMMNRLLSGNEETDFAGLQKITSFLQPY